MEQQLFLGAGLVFKRESVFMLHMLFTSTVPVIDFSLPQFKQHSRLIQSRRCLVPWEVYGSSFIILKKKDEALKDVQNILNLPELKVVKPSDTRWLSHERCVRAILKELPSLIITLDNLYESTGDAEAYGLSLVLSSFTGIATIFLLSAVLDLLATLNCFLQRNADFSKLSIILDSILCELERIRLNGVIRLSRAFLS